MYLLIFRFVFYINKIVYFRNALKYWEVVELVEVWINLVFFFWNLIYSGKGGYFGSERCSGRVLIVWEVRVVVIGLRYREEEA